VPDDADSLRALMDGILITREFTDYLVVRNPALGQSTRYDGSPLEKALLSLGAAQVTLPDLSEMTLRAIARAEAKAGRKLSFPEAVERLEDFDRAELEYFLTQLFLQFDRVAHLLLPTAAATALAKTAPAPAASTASPAPFGVLSINLNA
jgi:hypothetical protein